MLVVLLCCMMKIVEFSTGKPVGKPRVRRRRKYVRRKGKTMNEVGSLGIRGLAVSPDSDCNSNHHGSASYLSNTSSQDIDFIQDNSDYQWFLDYGYRDGGTNHHTSILSLPESYEANDMNYYDALAKNMDANLAEADMESFRTEDIHALLTNLPPMCTDHLSQENNRQGESYASVSGSMMAKFDFDSSLSPHSSSHGEDSANSTSMSIYKSELLFSPVKETPMPGANFSVDSLDCDMMLTCQANKDNYTIAFEGSTLYSEDSDYHDDKSENSGMGTHWVKKPTNNCKLTEASMTQSDSSSFTTWSKLKKRSSDNQLRRHPSGNNNNSGDETSLTENSAKSQSMPNLYKKKLNYLKNHNFVSTETIRRKPVKVFDIQHQSSSVSDMATSIDASTSETTTNKHQHNFSLVKLFMKQKSMSTEGMSTTMDQLSSTENWPGSQSGESNSSDSKPELDQKTNESSVRTYDLIAEEPEEEVSRSESVEQLSESISKIDYSDENVNNNNTLKHELMNQSIQTSQFSEITNLKNIAKPATKPVKIVEPSFLNKLKQEGEVQKPVYVLYPNYVLPNLDFLNKQDDMTKVLLIPQEPNLKTVNKRRPFSCTDLEMLKKKGFSHVKDWDSLNFLLPQEYRKILAEVPEISENIKKSRKRRPFSCDYSSSSSSTATQPSSGYRGSSTMLSDSQNSPATNLNPLFVYRYDSVTSSEASLLNSGQRSIMTAPPLPVRCVSLQQGEVPPRPPLPKGILRKVDAKRFSLYETSEEDLTEEGMYRRNILRKKRFSETEDEGVDAGTSSSSVDEHHEPPKTDFLLSNISTDELVQLEEFLKISGISTSDNEEMTDESLMQLRSYVGKFLSLKINQDGPGKKTVSFAEKVNVLPKQFTAPNNSPNVSKNYFGKNLAEMPICEESENSNYSPVHKPNLVEKRSLVNAVTDSVEQLINHFSSACNQSELNTLGDSGATPNLAKLALSTLCPALYAVLSDGLKPSLESSFGAINNSVWQVVEASAQQGPLTKALNELVMRINSEDAITEGLVKFNAFVFGLLNVRSLDAWVSYLKTRESILRKHYNKDSLIMAHVGGLTLRTLLDSLISALQPLALLPFQLDLLFEYRQLHLSFKRLEQLSPTHKNRTSSSSDDVSVVTVIPDLLSSSKKKERPRSCVESGSLPKPNFKLGDVTTAAKKRWSGISSNSKLYLVYDRLAREDEEEYTDSLENQTKPDDGEPPESLDSNISDDKPINGRRFKKLQQKWEMLSGRESNPSPPSSPTNNKSKIPRPITSPIKPSGIPILISPSGKSQKTPKKNLVQAKPPPKPKKTTSVRVDQVESETPRHVPRPSSLPYKAMTAQKVAKVTPPRRAASSSLSRKPVGKSNVPKVVRTLSHRVPSESGHLSYNEGERLKVVLEVDDKWLLCCRGSQKGLVPKSAVISADSRF
ncbi:uncharacterized protein LOC661485 isoform X2 [Tribolium castaneum]|uniref:uncharacterized protein LOC661485 isoform X2 n=1 Tax=Tribolium castaneum TaxID=7070 RepID=UPI00046C2484|nr:PREDICTED: uncharacterized protein LOC661485 isoform X2 [Tribolium castaneum]|eukprot:XP_015839730.1 PREDICTED: uncharacterized protein LOC661485 isoform X2 [Tribolium castaneum]